MKVEIHFNDKPVMREMTVYLPEYNQTYFVSVDGYVDQLFRMKSPYATDIVKEIKLFLEK